MTLVQLLNSTDPAVLPLVLVALIGFAAHRQHYAHVTGPAALETLLRIVQQYDLPFKRLAGGAGLGGVGHTWHVALPHPLE